MSDDMFFVGTSGHCAMSSAPGTTSPTQLEVLFRSSLLSALNISAASMDAAESSIALVTAMVFMV